MRHAILAMSLGLLTACADSALIDGACGQTQAEVDPAVPWVATVLGSYEPVELELIEDGSVPTASPCVTLDFETDLFGASVDAGDDMETRFKAGYGLTISTFDRTGTTAATGITFDSSDPTGGDADLGTPNEAYGGPGRSADGSGASNDVDAYNVLIRAEDTVDSDGDGLVDDPDDHASGAFFELEWLRPQNLESVVLLDVEFAEVPAEIRAYDASGALIGSVDAGGEGDNSREEVELSWASVTALTIKLQGSGAVDDLVFCPAASIPE